MRFPLLVVAGLAASLAGCGAPISAPSLGLRPVERQPIPMPATASEPEVAADPALVGALAAQLDAAEAGDRHFQAARVPAERLVTAAKDAAVGSEAWTAAQQALSALEAARGPVRDAIVAVESTRQDPGNAGTGARAAIARAAAQIELLQTAQAGAVAALSARLR